MTISKVEFSIGPLSFSGEGEASWLAKQLDKVIEAGDKIAVSASQSVQSEDQVDTGIGSGTFNTSLAAHITAKGGDSVQNKRFLATADWLRRKGTKNLSTAMITKALADNHQKRIGRPGQCFSQNVKRGFLEGTTSDFYITPDGLKDLGED